MEEFLKEHGIDKESDEFSKGKIRAILKQLLAVESVKKEIENFESLIKDREKLTEFKSLDENFKINLIKAYFVFNKLSTEEKGWVKESTNLGLKNLVKMFNQADEFIRREYKKDKTPASIFNKQAA